MQVLERDPKDHVNRNVGQGQKKKDVSYTFEVHLKQTQLLL